LQLFAKGDITKEIFYKDMVPSTTINPVSALDTRILDKSFQILIKDYQDPIINRYTEALLALKPEEAKNEEDITSLKQVVGMYRKSLYCQPHEVVSRVIPIIEEIT